METAAILRSFHGVARTTQHAQFSLDKPIMVPISITAFKLSPLSQVSVAGRSLISSLMNQRHRIQPCVKASDAETTPGLAPDAVVSEKTLGVLSEKKNIEKSIFPNGFETLVLEVCDETDIAELKLKVGDFEMHLKRDVSSPKYPALAISPMGSPATAPPIPSEPMIESGLAAQPAAPQKSTPAVTSPFANVSSSKALKLASLEASGSNAYVLVSSPTVGSFQRARTLKGKKQPPSCKEGDMIKEGQTIGFLDQFGNELPVRSDVAGEVLKILFKDGEPVGYGDPLVAVLPSFHGIK